MADLTNRVPSTTFKSLLKVGPDDNQTVDTLLRPIEDGVGVATALSLSTAEVGIGGDFLTDSISEFVFKGMASTTEDVFSVKYLLDSNKIFGVGYTGTLKLATQESEPSEETGGFYFDGSDFFINT
jgi:hypothetical protein